MESNKVKGLIFPVGGEDYCKHIVAGFLGDRDLDWASGYIDEEKIKNGQVMPADLKSALSMALDNELSTSWAYLDALSSQCAEIFNKFAGYIEFAGLARGVLVPGEYDVFISVSPDAVLRQYPDITIDEAIQIRDNACENIWESGGQSDLDEIVWDQIGAEYKSIKSDSHRGLSDVKDAKAKQAVHVNDDRKNDAVALDMQEK